MEHTDLKLDSPFVNLMSDFGFKRIFGEEESKSLLIDFLNALFMGEIIVEDVLCKAAGNEAFAGRMYY